MGSVRYRALDGLRGISALMVVFYHFSLEIFDTAGLFKGNFFVQTSYAFVDFFFVLSGFVIGHNYLDKINNDKELRSYMVKRFARLYPLLFVTVLFYVGMKLYAMYFTEFQFESGDYSIHDLIMDTLEPLTFMNSVPILGTSAGLNPVSWSISAEMISYVVFGFIVFFAKKRRVIFISIWVLFCLFFVIYNNRYLYTGEWGAIRAGLNFGIGVLVYLLSNKLTLKKAHWETFFVLLLIVVFYIIYHQKSELYNLMLPILFALGVFVFSFEKGTVSKLLKLEYFQFLGKVSYSVYLTHFIILWVYYQTLSFLSLSINSQFSAVLVLFFIISILLVVSSQSYRLIELKGGKWVKKQLLTNT